MDPKQEIPAPPVANDAPPPEGAANLDPTSEQPPAANDDSQEAYDAVSAVVDTLLYKDKNASEAIMQSISKPPFERAIGQAAAQVVQMIDERFEGKLPDDIIIPSAVDTAEKIAKMGEAAGLFKIDGAFVQKTIGFATAAAGELYNVSPEQMQQQAQEAEGAAPADAGPPQEGIPEGQMPAEPQASAPPAGLMDAANVPQQ